MIENVIYNVVAALLLKNRASFCVPPYMNSIQIFALHVFKIHLNITVRF